MHCITLCLLFALPTFADMNINVPFLQQAPTIDGDLSEWKDYGHNDGVWDMRRIAATSFYTLDRGARNRLTMHGEEGHLSDDLSARYYLAWDDHHFYFGAEVRDNVNDVEDPVTKEEFDGSVPYDSRWYFKDAICWFIEGPRDAASEWFGQGDNAFCFTASSEQIAKNAWWRHGAPKQNYIEEPLPAESVEWSVKMNPWGQSAGDFILEARVAMTATFAHSDPRWQSPQVGDEYGVEIVHTDPDGGGYGGHFMIYGNGDDDNTWGRMILTGPNKPLGRKSK